MLNLITKGKGQESAFMEKIYIIEDDENIRNLLKIALEGFGFEAEGFETAEEGLGAYPAGMPVHGDLRLDAPGNGRGDGHPADSSDRGDKRPSDHAFDSKGKGAG